MAIIVRYAKNDLLYIYLGAGYGKFKSTRSSFLGGDLFPHTQEGSECKIAVCDDAGKILWGDADDLSVASIDGETPASILSEAKARLGC